MTQVCRWNFSCVLYTALYLKSHVVRTENSSLPCQFCIVTERKKMGDFSLMRGLSLLTEIFLLWLISAIFEIVLWPLVLLKVTRMNLQLFCTEIMRNISKKQIEALGIPMISLNYCQNRLQKSGTWMIISAHMQKCCSVQTGGTTFNEWSCAISWGLLFLEPLQQELLWYVLLIK